MATSATNHPMKEESSNFQDEYFVAMQKINAILNASGTTLAPAAPSEGNVSKFSFFDFDELDTMEHDSDYNVGRTGATPLQPPGAAVGEPRHPREITVTVIL